MKSCRTYGRLIRRWGWGSADFRLHLILWDEPPLVCVLYKAVSLYRLANARRQVTTRWGRSATPACLTASNWHESFDYWNCLLQTGRSGMPWPVGNGNRISAIRAPGIGQKQPLHTRLTQRLSEAADAACRPIRVTARLLLSEGGVRGWLSTRPQHLNLGIKNDELPTCHCA